jgi:hypothetical protein
MVKSNPVGSRSLAKPKQVIAIYDSGGGSMDRYTLVLEGLTPLGHHHCLGLSDNPGGVYGFSNFGDCKLGSHLGKKIKFSELPKEVQFHARLRLRGR